jgi:hypothetical protein
MKRYLVRVVLSMLGLLLVGAAPVSAHSAEGSPSSNYSTTIDSVVPTPVGFSARVIERGNRMEVRWISGSAIIVEGYEDEPYLRIGPNGVEENRQSSATYTNQSRNGTESIPSDLEPDGPPEWKVVSVEPVARFHDHRAHFMGSVPPPLVLRSPGDRQLVQDFTIKIRPVEGEGGSTLIVGRVEWIPSPSKTPLLAFAAVLALVLAGIAAFAGVRAERRHPVTAVMMISLVGLVIVDVLHLIGIAGGVIGGSVLGRIVNIGYASIAAWMMSLVAIVLLLQRREDAMYLLTFAAGLMTLVGGVADLNILSRSSVVFLWSDVVARVLVAATLGLGIGLVVAGVLLTRPVRSANPLGQS